MAVGCSVGSGICEGKSGRGRCLNDKKYGTADTGTVCGSGEINAGIQPWASVVGRGYLHIAGRGKKARYRAGNQIISRRQIDSLKVSRCNIPHRIRYGGKEGNKAAVG